MGSVIRILLRIGFCVRYNLLIQGIFPTCKLISKYFEISEIFYSFEIPP